ncbi:MAG TPA: undecaprenyl-diphosphatase UppP [Thermoanaerobaculia bacterium]|nr:undecaprenyl-diphosphatase UppP [Thermoanaerobaculia bacterium]
MTLLQAVILGIVQGLTEFIPISSTAHLRIIPALLGWEDPGAAASAVIQLGTLLAVLLYFSRDLIRMGTAFVRGIVSRKPFEDHDSRLAWLIALGSIPVGVLGLTFKDFIENEARNLWIITFSLIFIAIVLLVAEAWIRRRESKPVEEITATDAILIGLGQSLALIPGASRSGSTIMAGLFRRLNHAAAARFSFLLSIPAIAASGLFELMAEWKHLAVLGFGPILVAVFISFLTGWASIWFLLRYLRTHTTHLFIWYRISLGVLIAAMLMGGMLEAM